MSPSDERSPTTSSSDTFLVDLCIRLLLAADKSTRVPQLPAHHRTFLLFEPAILRHHPVNGSRLVLFQFLSQPVSLCAIQSGVFPLINWTNRQFSLSSFGRSSGLTRNGLSTISRSSVSHVDSARRSNESADTALFLSLKVHSNKVKRIRLDQRKPVGKENGSSIARIDGRARAFRFVDVAAKAKVNRFVVRVIESSLDEKRIERRSRRKRISLSFRSDRVDDKRRERVNLSHRSSANESKKKAKRVFHRDENELQLR